MTSLRACACGACVRGPGGLSRAPFRLGRGEGRARGRTRSTRAVLMASAMAGDLSCDLKREKVDAKRSVLR
jgi:hypothetical protein